MDSMREQAAKALAEYFEYPDDWEPYLEQVDVVLEAIKSPSPGICVAGATAMSAVIPDNVPLTAPVAIAQPNQVFDAMIQAIIDGK